MQQLSLTVASFVSNNVKMDSSFNEVGAANAIRTSKSQYFLVKMPKDFDMKTLHKLPIDVSGASMTIKDNQKQYCLTTKRNISNIDSIFRPIVHDQTIDAAAVGPKFSGSIQIRQFFATSSSASSPDIVPQVILCNLFYDCLLNHTDVLGIGRLQGRSTDCGLEG